MGEVTAKTGPISSQSTAPAQEAEVITPADATVIGPYRSLYIGGTGTLTVVMVGDPTGSPVTFSAIPVGTILPIAVKQVNLTGTSATLIVGMK